MKHVINRGTQYLHLWMNSNMFIQLQQFLSLKVKYILVNSQEWVQNTWLNQGLHLIAILQKI